MKFFTTVLASVLLTNLFVWWGTARILRKAGARRVYKLAFHGFMIAQIAAQFFLIVGRMKGLDVDALMPKTVMIATYIWHLILAPIAMVVNVLELLREAGVLTHRFFRKRWPRALNLPAVPQEEPQRESVPTPSAPPAHPAHAHDPEAATPVATGPVEPTAPPLIPISRRQFLTASVALTPPGVTILSSLIASRQIEHFRIREITVPSPQLPKELDGMTVAHLSDIHVGRFSHGRVLRKIAEATNELKADLVTVTGDLLNDSLRWMPEAIDMLNAIDSPLYLCEGNHDLIDDPFEFRAQIKALPERYLLLNETRTAIVRGVPVQMMGLCWSGPNRTREQQFRGEFTLGKLTEHLMRQRDPALYQIMLAHHPHAWDHAPEVPLTLAGHTHGGQLMLNEELGVGPMMFRYWTGLYHRLATPESPDSALVVSNGAGNWFPLRIAAPAEIVHITLRRV